MKQAGKFKPVMNLFEWLPPQGELRTVLRHDGAELHVEVFYEDESDATEKSKAIVFTGVCSFFASSTPGVDLLALHYDQVAMDGSLVEFEDSEAAMAWSEHFQYRRVRHFQLYFLYANQRLEVFAEACHLQATAIA